MATKLYDYFKTAGEIGGVKARTRLSMLTQITSIESISIPDSDENLKKFASAMITIQKEFSGLDTIDVNNSFLNKAIKSNLAGADQLRKHILVFSELISQRTLYMGDLNTTYKRITEAIVNTINIERASIWMLDDMKTGIKCTDLYVRSTKDHTSGLFLSKSMFPSYFKAIETERTLSAVNAHTDSRTKEFTEVYLKPLKIGALLDVPIWVAGKMVGVVCHEHVGESYNWSADEEHFAYLMSSIISISIENKK